MGVNANTSVQSHREAWETLTPEGTFSVHASPVHTDPGCLTLVDVSAVAPVGRQLETGLANALEASVLVDAHAVQAHVPDAAFVHIFTVLAVCCHVKPSVTDTVEAAVRVDASPVVTDPSVLQAFVDVSAFRPH